jgi:hypothetical protein
LDDLVVEGARSPQQAEFAPNRLRYSVIAQETPEPLVVTATAASDLAITVAGQPAESGEAVELPELEPGKQFEVSVSDADGASRTYAVLYLPSNFPLYRVTVLEPGASNDPIYLAMNSGNAHFVTKLDNYGVPLFYKSLVAEDFKKHWNGVLSFYAQKVHKLRDANFDVLGDVTSIGYENTNPHDFVILPNGNYAVIAYNKVVRDLTDFGGAADSEVTDGILQEITPEGDLLFEWNSWDYFTFEENPDFTHTKNLDYAHINSIDVDDNGDWIVSVKRKSQVIKIERDTGDVVWRLGGQTSDFEIENDPLGSFCQQHTASFLDNGHILVFDNGGLCSHALDRSYSRVAEYALDFDQMTAELVWTYEPSDPIFAEIQGSAQRLPNGNTFVGWGPAAPHVATEVDPDGNVVFNLDGYGPDGELAEVRSYRARRFAE